MTLLPGFHSLARTEGALRACRWGRCVLASWLVFAAGAAAGAEKSVSKEYQLKAAFLYNFTKFVEWPPQHFRSDEEPIVIGVFGHNPFGGELELMVKDRKVNGRRLVVKAAAAVDELEGVDVLFVSAPDEEQVAALADRFTSAGVLTVGETSRFLGRGGVIVFVPDGDKIRFEIEADAAARSGLKISAQLQKLALAVHRQR